MKCRAEDAKIEPNLLTKSNLTLPNIIKLIASLKVRQVKVDSKVANA